MKILPRERSGYEVGWLVWRVVEAAGQADDATTDALSATFIVRAEFRLSIDAPDAVKSWPDDFTLTATWTLFPNRLELELDLLAHGTMPAAFGLHPYHPVPVIPGADPDAVLRGARGELLPRGVPTLASRWVPGGGQTFGAFSDVTFAGYH